MSAVEGKSKKRRRADVNPIERTNRKSDEQFIADHLRPRPDWTRWTHPHTQQAYRLSLTSAGQLGAASLEACYALVERTSRADYEASSSGWKPAKKRAEMRSPELRYVLVHNDGVGGGGGDDDDDTATDGGSLVAFTSLMPTYEEGEPVVYCYEVHLQEDLRGTGLAQLLMGFQEAVARNTPTVDKVMLTCFLRNERALAFYRKIGFEKDDISPGPRTLRGGRVFVPDYVIMSKMIRQ